MSLDIQSDDVSIKKEEKLDENFFQWITFDDILEALPRFKARYIVLKINVFVIGWMTSSANVFLVLDGIFHSQLPEDFEGNKIPYVVVLLFLSLSEVLGFFHGLLLVYGVDISLPHMIRDSMILATIATVSNWMSLLTIFLTGLPLDMVTQPLVMIAFTFIGIFTSNSYYFLLLELLFPDPVIRSRSTITTK